MCLLIAGGATGGHLLPALAVAEAFRVTQPDAELLVVGRFGGMEERLVPEAAFALETPKVLLATLDGLSSNRLRAMAECSARLGRPDATARIVQVLDQVAAGRG